MCEFCRYTPILKNYVVLQVMTRKIKYKLEFIIMKHYAPTDVNQALKFCENGGPTGVG